jgi:hypothetical protein
LLASTLIATLLAAFSRLYLGARWGSTVVGSWPLSLTCLTVFVGFSLYWSWYQEIMPATRAGWTRSRAARRSGVPVVGSRTRTTRPFVLIPAFRTRRELTIAFGEGGLPTLLQEEVRHLPRFSEKLRGAPQAPVGLLFIGGREQLVSAFRSAGWHAADPVSWRSVARLLYRATLDRSYPSAPVTPSFLGRRVQDLAFQAPAGTASARRRHHSRWWLTSCTVEGEPIWAATASLDIGLRIGWPWVLPIHRIDPDIDTERDFISRSLTATGLVAHTGSVRVTPPLQGRNAGGDLFSTGGMATVLSQCDLRRLAGTVATRS